MTDRSLFYVARPRHEALARVFCFPHAGGGPVAFAGWPEELGPEIECVALQYAGRGQRLREAPRTSIAELVEEIAAEIEPWVEKPYAFYGHSLGALVALELARGLRRMGVTAPAHLFVGAARAPHMERLFPPIHAAGDEEFIDAVQQRYGGIPQAILSDPEVLGMFLPAMRADFQAFETYEHRAEAPLHIPLTVFGGVEDGIVRPDALAEWKRHTASVFDLHMLSGGHFFPVSETKTVIRAIKTALSVSVSETTSSLAG